MFDFFPILDYFLSFTACSKFHFPNFANNNVGLFCSKIFELAHHPARNNTIFSIKLSPTLGTGGRGTAKSSSTEVANIFCPRLYPREENKWSVENVCKMKIDILPKCHLGSRVMVMWFTFDLSDMKGQKHFYWQFFRN